MTAKGVLLQRISNKSPRSLVIPESMILTNSDEQTQLAEAVVYGADTPTATATVPTHIGQIYVDTNAHKVYIAEDTDDVDGFLVLN